MQNNKWIKIAGLFGFAGVALGAFAAHMLRQKLDPYLFEVFNVGIKYHLIHTITLLALALYASIKEIDIKWPGYFFSFGILIFSGSLYVMAVTGIKILGMITPIGGLLFLAGWGWIVLKLKK